jgi:hypothetical protein
MNEVLATVNESTAAPRALSVASSRLSGSPRRAAGKRLRSRSDSPRGLPRRYRTGLGVREPSLGNGAGSSQVPRLCLDKGVSNKCITLRHYCISTSIEDNTTLKMFYAEALVKYNIQQTPSAKEPQNRNGGHIALGPCALRQVHTFEKMGTAA